MMIWGSLFCILGAIIPILLLLVWMSYSNKRRQDAQQRTLNESVVKGAKVRMMGTKRARMIVLPPYFS